MSNYLGSYEVDEVVVRSVDGKKVDISELVGEINITSTIVDASNVAKILITDTRNVLSFPIVGGCFIDIKLAIDGENLSWTYRVATVSSIHNTEKERIYIIEAISEFLYNSMFQKVSKAYTGKVSEIAYKIFEDHTTEKYGLWDESNNSSSVIIPMWSPIVALQWLASRAINKETNTRFRFFQDSKGRYQFYALEQFGNTIPKIKYTFNANTAAAVRSGTEIPDSKAGKTAIIDLKYHDAFDISAGLKDGFLSGRNYNVDISTKSWATVDYNFFEDLDDNYKDAYINKYPLYTADDFKVGKFSVNIDGDFPDNAIIDASSIHKTSVLRYNQSITIVVRGNNAVEPGQVVDVEIPNPDPADQDEDKLWSGRYYIAGKRDKFAKDGYMTALDLVKDGSRK